MERHPPTDNNRTTSRIAMYEGQTLCTKLLDSITVAVPLQILPSKIAGADASLFTTKDIDYGEEILQSRPVVNYVQEGMHELVCDYCYAYSKRNIHSSVCFVTPEDPELESMKACSGRKVCYYCSKAITWPVQPVLNLRRVPRPCN